MIIKLYYIFFIFIGLAFIITVNAQVAKASIDKNNIFIGEQIKLTLSADSIDNKYFLSKWFQLSPAFEHFEVIEKSNIDTFVSNTQHHYQQTITITSFDSGNWEIPPLTILLRTANNKKEITRRTLPLTLQVLPANVSQVTDLHDVKDIITFPNSNQNSNNKSIIAFVLLIIIGGCLIWAISKKRKKTSNIKIEKIDNPHDWAIEQFALLEKKQQSTDISLRSYYTELYHICRYYFFLEFTKPVLFQTTSEWISLLKTLPVEENLKRDFCDLLIKIDEMRFAHEKQGYLKNDKEILILAKSMITRFNKIKSF